MSDTKWAKAFQSASQLIGRRGDPYENDEPNKFGRHVIDPRMVGASEVEEVGLTNLKDLEAWVRWKHQTAQRFVRNYQYFEENDSWDDLYSHPDETRDSYYRHKGQVLVYDQILDLLDKGRWLR